jgi:hypothetical protein
VDNNNNPTNMAETAPSPAAIITTKRMEQK